MHFGHLHLAIELLEGGEVDEILFCPANRSPFKESALSGHHRLEMLRLVLSEIPLPLRVTDIEINRPGPSFTVDTLRELQKGGVEYRLIISEEVAAQFHLWKEPEEIKKLAPLLTGKREWPISSTQIRERLKKNFYCGHLIPRLALDYIVQNRLYSFP